MDKLWAIWLLDTLKIKDLDELYISIGAGKFTISSIMKLICPKENPIEKKLNKYIFLLHLFF